MKTHINYESESDRRTWWLNNTGGNAKDNLTVRDYFAAKAMQSYVGKGNFGFDDMARWAYAVADAMMKQRALDKQGEL